MNDIIEIAIMFWYITIPLFVFLILLIFFLIVYFIELFLRRVDYIINRRNLKKIEIKISNHNNIPDQFIPAELSEGLLLEKLRASEKNFDKLLVFKKIFKMS